MLLKGVTAAVVPAMIYIRCGPLFGPTTHLTSRISMSATVQSRYIQRQPFKVTQLSREELDRFGQQCNNNYEGAGGRPDGEQADDNSCLHVNNKEYRPKLKHFEFKKLGRMTERATPQHPSLWWKKKRPNELEHRSENVHPTAAHTQTTKLSTHGSPDSLFLDCLDRIRDARQHMQSTEEDGVCTRKSPEIEELTRIEKGIIYKILKRVDPSQEVGSNLEYSGDYIDPFWNPFKSVQDIKKEIHYEFSAYSRLHSTAEAMRQHQLLKRKYQVEYGLLDPLQGQKDKSRLDTSIPDDPKYPQFTVGVPDRLWDPSALRRKVLFNNNRPITWRDLHILKFFVSESGMFLPRRLTMATRRQQTRAFKAIMQARGLGVFPYDWRPPDTEQMILEDPLQFMTDILTLRYKERGDLRAEAMIKVMMKRFKKIDYRQYLFHASTLRRRKQRRLTQTKKERSGDFAHIVDRCRKQ